jgi:hypothetical protein
VDFIYYWDHRIGHRVRIAWALYHSVHHSSPLFNQTTAVRISFLDGFIVPWFYVPIVVAGFHPLLVLSAFGVVLAYHVLHADQHLLSPELVQQMRALRPWSLLADGLAVLKEADFVFDSSSRVAEENPQLLSELLLRGAERDDIDCSVAAQALRSACQEVAGSARALSTI